MPGARPAHEPDTGDFIWIDLDPTAGHEQRGRRLALVLSPIGYNAKTGLMLACPITNRVKGYPFEQALPKGMVPTGVALCDQVRCLDWRARNVERIGVAPAQLTQKVLGRLGALLGYDSPAS